MFGYVLLVDESVNTYLWALGDPDAMDKKIPLSLFRCIHYYLYFY